LIFDLNYEEDISNVKLSKQLKIIPDRNLVVQSQIGGKLFLKEISENLLVLAAHNTLKVNSQ